MIGQDFQIPTLAAMRPPSPGLTLDFAVGAYRLNGTDYGSFASTPGAAFSRTGAASAQTAAGGLIAFASGAPRMTDRGLLIEEARTNKITAYNANPTDLSGWSIDAGLTATIVDDTTALAAAGLWALAASGNVVRLINGSGGALSARPAGVTGNVNTHVASAFVRGGTGDIRAASGTGITTFAASAGYVRRMSSAFTPASTAATMAITVDAGQTVHVVLAQLEEGAFATSPIVTSGAAATRGADVAAVTGLSSLLAFPVVLFTKGETAGTSGFPTWGAVSDGSTGVVFQHYRAGANSVPYAQITSGGGTALAALGTSNSVPAGQVAAIASRIDAAGSRSSRDGLAAVAATRANGAYSQVAIGGTVGANNLPNGFIQRVRIIPGDLSDAQLQALTQ